MSKAPETEDRIPEVLSPGAMSAAAENLNEDRISAILRLAEQSDKLGAALDKLRKFVLGRALPGDWVRFAEKDKPGSLELTGPGAERIASALGISFEKWRDWKESGSDANGEWFTWWYEADVFFQGRRLEKVQGRAGSRDRFFGYAYGEWKSLSDIKEADVRTAARRSVFKEGTKLMLGLRRIPEGSAAALGLDIAKVTSVDFAKGGTTVSKPGEGAAAGASGAAGDDGSIVGVLREVKEAKKGTGKKGAWVLYSAILESGKSANFFGTEKELLAKANGLIGKRVGLFVEQGKYGLDLKNIAEKTAAPASAPAATEGEDPGGTAQEPEDTNGDGTLL